MSATDEAAIAEALNAAEKFIKSSSFPREHRGKAADILLKLRSTSLLSLGTMMDAIEVARKQSNSTLTQGEILALGILDSAVVSPRRKQEMPLSTVVIAIRDKFNGVLTEESFAEACGEVVAQGPATRA